MFVFKSSIKVTFLRLVKYINQLCKCQKFGLKLEECSGYVAAISRKLKRLYHCVAWSSLLFDLLHAALNKAKRYSLARINELERLYTPKNQLLLQTQIPNKSNSGNI